jgi:hypothetical protein
MRVGRASVNPRGHRVRRPRKWLPSHRFRTRPRDHRPRRAMRRSSTWSTRPSADSRRTVRSRRTSSAISTPPASTGRSRRSVRFADTTRSSAGSSDGWRHGTTPGTWSRRSSRTAKWSWPRPGVHGRGRRSGMEISQRLFDVFELREGKVLRVTEYLDREGALQAAGLLQPWGGGADPITPHVGTARPDRGW